VRSAGSVISGSAAYVTLLVTTWLFPQEHRRGFPLRSMYGSPLRSTAISF